MIDIIIIGILVFILAMNGQLSVNLHMNQNRQEFHSQLNNRVNLNRRQQYRRRNNPNNIFN